MQKALFWNAKQGFLERKTMGIEFRLTMPKFTSHFFVYCY